MLLLISDANILIDMEAGNLMDAFFRLPMQFAVPDVLYWEEIEPGSPGLEHRGMRVLEVSGEFVAYALGLGAKYGAAPSYNDYLALALAKQEDCSLLTGDQGLKCVAGCEGVTVMGTVWLLCAMVASQLVTIDQALAALSLMRERKRRLPWAEAERALEKLRRQL